MKYFTLLLFVITIKSFGQHTDNNCRTFDAAAQSAFEASQLLQTGDNYDLKYHRCEWTVDPDVSYISGAVTTYLVANSSLSTIDFDLINLLTVDSVLYHNTHLTYSHASDIVQINLPAPVL